MLYYNICNMSTYINALVLECFELLIGIGFDS